MTEAELIVRQAKQLEELRDEVAALKNLAKSNKTLMLLVGERLPDDEVSVPSTQHNCSGRAALSVAFGSGRVSWLILPRVLLHEMSDEWQEKMAVLLGEYRRTFCNWKDGLGARVQVTMRGKVIKTPGWALNYRHPEMGEIDKLRRPNT